MQAFSRAHIWAFSLPSLTNVMHDPSQDCLFERRSNILEFVQIHHNILTNAVFPENLKEEQPSLAGILPTVTRATTFLNAYGIEWKELVSPLILRNPGERQHALFAKASDGLFSSRKI